MSRPFCVWFVFLASLLFFITGLVSAGAGLVVVYKFPSPESVIAKIEGARSQIAAMPHSSSSSETDLNSSFDQQIEMMRNLANKPLLRIFIILQHVAKIALALGLIIGAIRLFKLDLKGITILTIVYILDMMLFITGVATALLMGAIPTTEMGSMAMVVGLNLSLSLAPLLCLLFGNREDFS